MIVKRPEKRWPKSGPGNTAETRRYVLRRLSGRNPENPLILRIYDVIMVFGVILNDNHVKFTINIAPLFNNKYNIESY
ncbi:MAG: hypothetical protein BBJ57_08610 [Desulfobacterales bacterium PC51MH44]|nr:MAG: hypothetical protein BBJ57_08610 [Desulfobacterales bacterium PC51MH44]